MSRTINSWRPRIHAYEMSGSNMFSFLEKSQKPHHIVSALDKSWFNFSASDNLQQPLSFCNQIWLVYYS